MSTWEQWSFEFHDSSPIYRQIIRQFQRAFARAEIPRGSRIPSIRDMSVALKVNANTMQRVYQEMERDGLINSKRGTGYFFTEDEHMIDNIRKDLAAESLSRFVDEMRGLGLKDEEIVGELTEYMKEGEENANPRSKIA